MMDIKPDAYGCPMPEQSMSLRDWFAGQALAGVMRASIQQRDDSTIYWTDIATRAYGLADAMLAERNK